MNLISRLEQAEAGSRELDAFIFRTLAGNPTDHCYELNGKYLIDANVPNVTTSIDAAMSLVPEGWKLRQMHFNGPCADDRKWHLNLHGGKVGEDCFVGRGATPALALVIASLKAAGYE